MVCIHPLRDLANNWRVAVQFEFTGVVAPRGDLWETVGMAPQMDESLKDAILRILREAQKCLTASEIVDVRHEEIGGGVSITESLVEAAASIPQI